MISCTSHELFDSHDLAALCLNSAVLWPAKIHCAVLFLRIASSKPHRHPALLFRACGESTIGCSNSHEPLACITTILGNGVFNWQQLVVLHASSSFNQHISIHGVRQRRTAYEADPSQFPRHRRCRSGYCARSTQLHRSQRQDLRSCAVFPSSLLSAMGRRQGK